MQGLDAAIINPGDMGMRETLAAWRLLSGIDREAHEYIAYCQAHPEPNYEIGRASCRERV